MEINKCDWQLDSVIITCSNLVKGLPINLTGENVWHLYKGIEGAAANAQVKQLEQQNSRLKEAIMRWEMSWKQLKCHIFNILCFDFYLSFLSFFSFSRGFLNRITYHKKCSSWCSFLCFISDFGLNHPPCTVPNPTLPPPESHINSHSPKIYHATIEILLLVHINYYSPGFEHSISDFVVHLHLL